MIDINESIFLKDYQTFEKHLLPIVNEERMASGLAVLTQQEATDYYLDKLIEYRNAEQDPGPSK